MENGLAAFVRAVEAEKLRAFRVTQNRAVVERRRPLQSTNFLK